MIHIQLRASCGSISMTYDIIWVLLETATIAIGSATSQDHFHIAAEHASWETGSSSSIHLRLHRSQLSRSHQLHVISSHQTHFQTHRHRQLPSAREYRAESDPIHELRQISFNNQECCWKYSPSACLGPWEMQHCRECGTAVAVTVVWGVSGSIQISFVWLIQQFHSAHISTSGCWRFSVFPRVALQACMECEL